MAVTTTRGPAQVATLRRWSSKPVEVISGRDCRELFEALEESLLEAMERATHDGRQRRVTARGFDIETALTGRERLLRFWEIAVDRERLTPDDVPRYLLWWGRQLCEELQIEHQGLPVPADVAAVARAAGAVLPVVVVEGKSDTLKVGWTGDMTGASQIVELEHDWETEENKLTAIVEEHDLETREAG